MNPSTDQVLVAADELAPPSQPHRLSTSCDVHPEERFSGFCPSCLCERLSVLDHNGAPPQPSSSSRKPPTISTAALKALFKPSSGNNNANGNGRVRPGILPELRRSKSFSAKNNEGISGGTEPQRRSCDVRLGEENRSGKMEEAVVEEESGSECDPGEIIEEKKEEIVEEVIRSDSEERKAMKEYMDLYPYPHTNKPSLRSFFSAASVFTKKLQKWSHNHKIIKPRRCPLEKADTQSEIADYAFGRRSSDTDPRFSLDARRFSVDEPRASWDGHLITRTTLPPSMLSVVENAPVEESDPIIIIPGGSTQTRDYYTERRRKSLDRSNSIKKAMEMDEVKSVSNITDSKNVDKKSRRWGKWSMLGFIYRKGVSKDEVQDRYSRSNSTGMVERSLSESWPELRNEGGGPKMRRSNSNVSWRSSGSRNKSWRNSSKDGDNGMFSFYLTPSCRNGGWEKTAARANSHGHSIARRVMRLY